MKLRRFVSLFLLTGFTFLLATSVMLYIVPHGRVAYWSGWTMLGLSKTAWGNIHINLGLLLLIAAGLHLCYNWGAIKAYLKNRSKRMAVFTGEFILALALVAAIMTGTVLELPPLNWVQDLGESIKDAGGRTYGEPPYGHAERSSLETFTRRVGLDLATALESLESAGYMVQSPNDTLEELAEANGVTPQRLWDAMENGAHAGHGATAPARSVERPRHIGRIRLDALCTEHALDVENVLDQLSSHGIRAESGQTLREIADVNGTSPGDLYDRVTSRTEGSPSGSRQGSGRSRGRW